ncbi:hypothetical protein [Burkholderia sp. IDO3]|uniref:hypothetical protein n=1 Tax=Burkholderia sp. IDO3 TaxID=1705310 RepID=UPI000BBB3710|nr:hypothetical protein [Burkholderia sp. IDO3]AXK65054.1 hypothetical protein DCN14_20665 [Burkholderia sp. IDO3]PCD61849.1 hypothetical protein CN645_11580 [Burkholderia sp. IDO3]
MKRRTPDGSPESQRSVLLARMAATRAELSASNHVLELTRQPSARDRGGHPVVRLPALGGATGVAIAVALAGLAVLGPRRLVTTAVRAGLAAMIGRMTRDIVQK